MEMQRLTSVDAGKQSRHRLLSRWSEVAMAALANRTQESTQFLVALGDILCSASQSQAGHVW